MMYYQCCVCKRSRQDAILYHFPCTAKRRNKWLKCLNRDDLKELPEEQLSKLFVCQKHFERRFLTTKSRLLGVAYPSLLTEDEMLSGVPSRENVENMDPQNEHSYSRKRHFDHTYCAEPLKEVNTPGVSVLHCSPGTSLNPQILEAPEMITPGVSVLHCSPGTSRNPQVLEATVTTTNSVAAVAMDSQLQAQAGVAGLHITIKKAKACRKRLIRKIKDLTPTCQMIFNEYKKARKLADFHRRAKKALKFNKEKSFEKLTKNMNPYAKRIVKMQINLCTKRKKGYRFTTEEKLIALSIMKQSPKCYKFLHKIFILPSRSTLNKMVAKLNIQTGICPQVFNLMKKEVAEWNDKKKWCSIIFDEMSLDTALTYDKNKDEINGFVELEERKNNFADHALVFMVRGAVYKWQQPIAFYYCEGATSGVQLKEILKQIVSAVEGCGLKPIALICDQGAAFQAALKSLHEETVRHQILSDQEPDGRVIINGQHLNIIYDPSHLIKGLRNNFLNKNIKVDGKISKWSDIVDVYEADCYHAEARLLHKLTDQHVVPEKIKKMKVKNCVKVFSKTVSAALFYTSNFCNYADGRPVSNTLKNTAETVLFFDELFDSVNGAATHGSKASKKGKPLRTAVTETSPHHQFWKDAIKKLEKIKYIDSVGNEKSVPSLKKFVVTLKSLMRLWQFFRSQDIKIMRPRYYNSDPIENFFGQVRAYNYRSNDPNCHSFKCTFKSLLITRIIKFHNETFNCEDDPAEQAINLSTLFNEDNIQPGHPKNNIEMIVDQARRERINVHSRAYTAGWVVHKILNKLKISCNDCKKSLTSEKTSIHDWISQREYNLVKNRLKYPSEGAVRCFGTVVTETNAYLEQNPHNKKISSLIKDMILSKYAFDFIDCTEHKNIILDYFIISTIRFTILNWCNIISKILKGTDVFRLQKRNDLPMMQKRALEKYKKKLKNKSFNK